MSEMTDDERDQLLSDVLDGVATADDVARVDNDAELAADLRLMREAQSVMATPPPPMDAARRDTMIAAALDQLAPDVSAGGASPSPESPPAPVIDLAAQRAKRQRRLNLVGAAAALVLVVGAAAVALRAGPSDDADSTAAGDAETEATAEAFSQAADDSEMADQDSSARAAQGEEGDAAGGGLSQDALEDAESEEMAADDGAAEEMATQTVPADTGSDEASEAAPVAPTPLVLLPLPAEPCRDALNEAVPGFDRVAEVFVDDTTALLEVFVGEDSATVALALASCTVTVEFELGDSQEPAE